MGTFIAWAEVPGFTESDDWRITDAEAMALLAAPCLAGNLDQGQTDAVRAVLRQALMRWREAGAGAVTQQQAGPFGQTIDTRSLRRGMFWPSELAQLRDICGASIAGRAGTTSTLPTTTGMHLPWCSLSLGAAYCSCGVDIAGEPIFEGEEL